MWENFVFGFPAWVDYRWDISPLSYQYHEVFAFLRSEDTKPNREQRTEDIVYHRYLLNQLLHKKT